ncbi:uncharacterized protein MYCFIDRAFT_138302 [Pseudocercospora fijiensis CIRAD86]|uniref:Protein FAF1 n=1 Tax=Pseudocercospora fijiensis (strain CIRAD86) TaxID=383855 RepID=M3AZ29_PSEFD|nr:uncharacterized protein MYCFIDRAFT_138302 [Pseudocercospora fijiensis CIRAD86]EME82472.1 hypothetical protein MYCFIDRAFT_138302 [Pseudocercospora fijiensis CIRAD86]
MSATLGKRKRRAEPAKKAAATVDSDSEGDNEARALFQKAFEAKFKPLEVQPVRDENSDGEDSDDHDNENVDESDWGGISEDEDAVEIVEHAQPDMDAIFGGLKNGKKSYMAKRPVKSTTKAAKPGTEDDGSEVANLKKDVALQRLLKESHLLDPSSFRSSTGPEGKDRIKALDMRLQDLGAKTSAIQQEKMPMSMRKGISGKAASREASRRKEAAENGIILEKFKQRSKASEKARVRGVTGPGIGKMQGSTLKLSARDVRSIQGPPGRKGRR